MQAIEAGEIEEGWIEASYQRTTRYARFALQ